MAAEPDHLLARRAVRDLERPALGGAPDRLHHVAEVEAADPEAQKPSRTTRNSTADHAAIAPHTAIAHERSRTRRDGAQTARALP